MLEPELHTKHQSRVVCSLPLYIIFNLMTNMMETVNVDLSYKRFYVMWKQKPRSDLSFTSLLG